MQPLCKTLTASNLLLQSYSHLKNRHHRQPRTKLLRKFKVFFPMRATHQCHKIKTKFPLPSPMQCCFGVKTNPDNSCVTQNSIGRGEGEYGYFCRNGCYLCYSSELHENVANFQIFLNWFCPRLWLLLNPFPGFSSGPSNSFPTTQFGFCDHTQNFAYFLQTAPALWCMNSTSITPNKGV